MKLFPASAYIQLEFDKIRDLLSAYCETEYAVEKSAQLRIHTQQEFIGIELRQSYEYNQLLKNAIYFPNDYILNLTRELKLLEIPGAVLNNEEQKQKAEKYKAELNKSGAFDKPVVTEITPFTKFYPDAENYLSVFYSKNPAPPNYTRYNNPAFDRIFERALSEPNDSARYQLYQQADKLIVEDAVVIPLWYDKAVHLVQAAITGFNPNALNMLELRKVRL